MQHGLAPVEGVDKGGGEVSKGNFYWLLLVVCLVSFLLMLILSPMSQKILKREALIRLLDYFHDFCLQFGTDPRVNTLCRSIQG